MESSYAESDIYGYGKACFSPSGLWLVAGSPRGYLSVWDFRTGAITSSVEISPVKALSFGSSGRQIITVSQDATIQHWNLLHGVLERCPLKPNGHVLGCARLTAATISPDGRIVGCLLRVRDEIVVYDTVDCKVTATATNIS
jgi:WD40 repeat protein